MSTDKSSGEMLHNGCAACAIIDKLDGKIDGKLSNLAHWKIVPEHKRWQSTRKAEDKAADKITSFAGSLNFVYIHMVWFAIWVSLNVGAVGASLKFDKYPFGLLTMLVSLEAIFLSTFVMVSQNRQAARADSRSRADFEANIQSLIWSVHIGQQVGLDIEHVETLCALAIDESRIEPGAAT